MVLVLLFFALSNSLQTDLIYSGIKNFQSEICDCINDFESGLVFRPKYALARFALELLVSFIYKSIRHYLFPAVCNELEEMISKGLANSVSDDICAASPYV